jgi:hypothetical protein
MVEIGVAASRRGPGRPVQAARSVEIRRSEERVSAGQSNPVILAQLQRALPAPARARRGAPLRDHAP